MSAVCVVIVLGNVAVGLYYICVVRCDTIYFSIILLLLPCLKMYGYSLTNRRNTAMRILLQAMRFSFYDFTRVVLLLQFVGVISTYVFKHFKNATSTKICEQEFSRRPLHECSDNMI